MAPPRVNMNEKPAPQVSEQDEAEPSAQKKEVLLSTLTDRYNDVAYDPLPEKKDGESSVPVIVTMDHGRRQALMLTAEQRRQRKRCRVACCVSLSVLLVLLLALGTACLVYRMKHRRSWRAWCGTKDGNRIPEHVKVDHDNNLIYVKPDHHTKHAMEMLHEYNRGMIAFRNTSANICYLDRLDETFSEGYARWQGYEETVHKQNRTLRVFPQKIEIDVVVHFADVHIVEHCGGRQVEYHWVMEVKQEEIKLRPNDKYITV